MRAIALFMSALLAATVAAETPELSVRDLEWTDGETTCRGVLVEPTVQVMMMHAYPGVLVFPEWWGVNDYSIGRARELAAQGRIVLVVDMYGDRATADTPEAAGALAGPFYQDRSLMERRGRAGLTALSSLAAVDPARIGAIGFCFGGTVGLELARRGAPVKAVVSLHGGLKTDTKPADTISSSILVCHGGNDGLVPNNELATFIDELNAAQADYRIEVYGGARHAFTNPGADRWTAQLPAVAYHADAAAAAMAATEEFLSRKLAR